VVVADQEAAVARLREELRPGDVVLVKGSRYRTWEVADWLRGRSAEAGVGGA
jgi:UDP-N-acetylmuramoyl-tripeptide--D-alanyl-D-alanine ligase